MSTLLATLRMASGLEEHYFVSVNGSTVAPTVASLKDDNDSTGGYAEAISFGPPDPATWGFVGTLDALALGAFIDFLRVRIRAKLVHVAGAMPGTFTVQPDINRTARGSPAPIGTAPVWNAQDFATDPADGLAWTEAKVNAQKFGWWTVTSPAANGTERGWCVEFAVEVWGRAGDVEEEPKEATLRAGRRTATVAVD